MSWFCPLAPTAGYQKAGKSFGPESPVWSYVAPKRYEFFAQFISGANRLPNGNTFICSGPNGTIFEVTPEKDIVWKYVNSAAAPRRVLLEAGLGSSRSCRQRRGRR